MPAGRNTKGQNGQDHEPNVPGGGLDARELPCSPVAGEVFFLDIPFYRATRLIVTYPSKRNQSL